MRWIDWIRRRPELRILALNAIVFAIVACRYPRSFLRWGEVVNELLTISDISIVAIGMTVLLVSGGFDLSVGSVFGLGGAVAAALIAAAVPIPAAIAAGLACGALVGLFNGFIIAFLGINPFITTLGTMIGVRGIVQVITAQGGYANLGPSFTWIGKAEVISWLNPSITMPVLIAAILVVVGDFLLRRARFFRLNYYIGGNEAAARLSGIPVRRVKLWNYALSGVLAALAGIVSAARFDSADSRDGLGLELQVITAVILGGASLRGGAGTVLGSVLGCLLVAIVKSASDVMNIDVSWQPLIVGSILLAAVVIDRFAQRP